jgi:YggT family protein
MSTRETIADFLSALLTVYTLIIFAYIISTLVLQFARPSYSRPLDAVLGFLRDVSEPYLRIFRRFIPPLGPIDISPIVAIFVLRIVGGIIITAVRG